MSISPLSKILSRDMLADVLETQRRQGRRIVFTNGCFDLLHIGHARYLADAKALGDLLIVGINTDRSVQRLKGPKRPLVPERERAELLAHLASVDYVTLFDEETPVALLEVVRPAIHVKGGDYHAADLPETPVVERHGGRVEIIPLTEGRSTTNLVQRIREAYASG